MVKNGNRGNTSTDRGGNYQPLFTAKMLSFGSVRKQTGYRNREWKAPEGAERDLAKNTRQQLKGEIPPGLY
jgi:hypothetical protein